MKNIIELQELAEINGGQITTGTSGQYDIGYLISSTISGFLLLLSSIDYAYPYLQ